MRKATIKDKAAIIDILAESFEDNASVNYVIKNDRLRLYRIRKLMEYSFNICLQFGDIFLSDDGNGCALVLYPDKKRNDLKALLQNINFAINCVGLGNIPRILERERKIKAQYPKDLISYLWFIGVRPEAQGKGVGSDLLTSLIRTTEIMDRSMYLETSMEENLKFYEKHGFELYYEMELPHQLFFMRKVSNQ